MGKSQAATTAAVSLEINGDSTGNGAISWFDRDSFCGKSNFRCIVTLILGVQLLVFALLMFRFHGKHGKSGPFPLLEVPIAASFRIRQSPSFIHDHLQQLELNISEEIGFPGKVAVVSIDHLRDSNWTEVTIGVPMVGSNNVSTKLLELKATFVKFFLRERNLSLPASSFGKVSDFQLEKFPGGITVVPEPSSLSRRHVLFNFTIYNTLSHLDSQFPEFKLQLSEGICLRSNENLVTRLTNLEGSTSKAPVIVQTSVFRAVGHHLPHQRLKQLAWHVTKHLSRNLGLNHTMFGRVCEVELSPFLKNLIDPHRLASTPTPTPTPAPSPSHSGHHGPHHPRHSHHHHNHHHHHHHHNKGSSPSGAIALATHFPDLAPQGSSLPFSPHSQAYTEPLSKSPQRRLASAPYPAYFPFQQHSSRTISLTPASEFSVESSSLPSPIVPSVSVQAPQGDIASSVQPPRSSACE